MLTPNHALQRTAAGRRDCNRRALWPPSLSLGRWASMNALRSQSIFPFLTLALCLCGCGASDPVADVALTKAPPEAQTFFQPGIERGVLYAFITADGDIFIYRRDLDKFGWVTLPQFRRFVAHAKACGGYLVYSLEDGDLKQAGCRDAFHVIIKAKIDTQDPVDVLPLVKQELQKRRKA